MIPFLTLFLTSEKILFLLILSVLRPLTLKERTEKPLLMIFKREKPPEDCGTQRHTTNIRTEHKDTDSNQNAKGCSHYALMSGYPEAYKKGPSSTKFYGV